MTAKREYLDYAQDIYDSIADIETFIAGMDYKRFAGDKKTVNAVIRSLEVIGEAAKKIPKEITNAYPKVPWREMCGMRDKLIHEYFGVDKAILWKVAAEDHRSQPSRGKCGPWSKRPGCGGLRTILPARDRLPRLVSPPQKPGRS